MAAEFSGQDGQEEEDMLALLQDSLDQVENSAENTVTVASQCSKPQAVLSSAPPPKSRFNFVSVHTNSDAQPAALSRQPSNPSATSSCFVLAGNSSRPTSPPVASGPEDFVEKYTGWHIRYRCFRLIF
jgi:hypothetical protein